MGFSLTQTFVAWVWRACRPHSALVQAPWAGGAPPSHGGGSEPEPGSGAGVPDLGLSFLSPAIFWSHSGTTFLIWVLCRCRFRYLLIFKKLSHLKRKKKIDSAQRKLSSATSNWKFKNSPKSKVKLNTKKKKYWFGDDQEALGVNMGDGSAGAGSV